MFSFGNSSSTSSNSNSSTSSGALYCRLNDKHLLELTVDKKLNLITPPREDSQSSALLTTSITNSRHLYTLPAAFIAEVAVEMKANAHSASSVAITFANQSVLVVSGLLSSSISLSIINVSTGVAWFDWHPLSPNYSHLVLLLRSGHLNLYALSQNTNIAEEGSESNDTLPRQIEPESSIKLNQNRFDPLVSACFAPSNKDENCNWTRFGLFVCSEAGEVHFICPVLPANFKAKRQSWLQSLAKSSDGMPKKWLKEALSLAKLLSPPGEEETDWILTQTGPSFGHLIPSLQGPFSIQPEPLEIHHLASYDRVCDFKALLTAQGDTLLAISFASGKIDLLLLGGDDDLNPLWQLPSQTRKNSNEPLKAYLVLLESIDVHNSTSSSNNKSSKRPVDAKVKFISHDRLLVSPGDGRVVEISVELGDEISIGAEVIASSSPKGTPQIALLNRLFPGAISLPESNNKSKENISPASLSSLSPVLERINRQAFPLGKMEIEGAALQLSSLLESTTKALKRLKEAAGKDSSNCKSKLPEAVKEAECGVLNDNVNKWQQEVVMPALRIGHELALRVEELVQILRTERQVLSRAHDLLTSKPDRLESLLKNISTAKERNDRLKFRLETLQKQIPPSKSGRLGDSAILPVLERMKNEFGRCMSTTSNTSCVDVVNVQLSLQSEVLEKLQKLLK